MVIGCGCSPCDRPDPPCDTSAPEICTTEYRPGDRCLLFARCGNTAAGRALVKDARSDACRACVDPYQDAGKVNPGAACSCREKC